MSGVHYVFFPHKSAKKRTKKDLLGKKIGKRRQKSNRWHWNDSVIGKI